MAEDKLTTSLQESVLTLICCDDRRGAIAANQIDVELFEPPYDDIAQRAISYRKRFKKPPGLAHLDDLFDHILGDPKSKRHHVYKQVLQGISAQSQNLNAEYVLSRVQDFQERQSLKVAVLDAAEAYKRGGDDLVTNVRTILNDALKFREDTNDSGIFLGDRKQVLRVLTNPRRTSYRLGIKELDRLGLGPTQGEVLAFMAPKGGGKTWFCIDAAVRLLQQQAKVVHISLEMSEERLVPRYMQRMFAISKRNESFSVANLEVDDQGRVVGLKQRRARARLSLSDKNIYEKIGAKLDRFGSRLSKLVVKEFPTSSLSIDQVEAYLDGLELTHGFTPDALIIDYPKLMKLPRNQEYRLAVGGNFESLRGMLIRRNLAGIFPIQSHREAESAKLITGQNIGEDYSMGQTADILITYNQTRAEHAAGLARLYVDKARNEEDKFAVLIAQNYKTGQFCRDSAWVPGNYWRSLKELTGKGEE